MSLEGQRPNLSAAEFNKRALNDAVIGIVSGLSSIGLIYLTKDTNLPSNIKSIPVYLYLNTLASVFWMFRNSVGLHASERWDTDIGRAVFERRVQEEFSPNEQNKLINTFNSMRNIADRHEIAILPLLNELFAYYADQNQVPPEPLDAIQKAKRKSMQLKVGRDIAIHTLDLKADGEPAEVINAVKKACALANNLVSSEYPSADLEYVMSVILHMPLVEITEIKHDLGDNPKGHKLYDDGSDEVLCSQDPN